MPSESDPPRGSVGSGETVNRGCSQQKQRCHEDFATRGVHVITATSNMVLLFGRSGLCPAMLDTMLSIIENSLASTLKQMITKLHDIYMTYQLISYLVMCRVLDLYWRVSIDTGCTDM